MFASVYTLAFFAALAAALQIEPLQNANSQGDTRITWINDAADTSRFSTFSVFLHHPTFNSDFALLNNQRPTDGGANVTLPAVPAQYVMSLWPQSFRFAFIRMHIFAFVPFYFLWAI
ncbi:hypothetical protein PTI98_004205 [Pleurotus ostreatus]|nr:hypothetical protein PTI98_004205 [Pleurotus ostreatus]